MSPLIMVVEKLLGHALRQRPFVHIMPDETLLNAASMQGSTAIVKRNGLLPHLRSLNPIEKP